MTGRLFGDDCFWAVRSVLAAGLDVGGDSGLEDLLDGDVGGEGGAAAVFELGCGVDDFGVEGADLDADFAEGSGDGGMVAGEADAALLRDADAEGGGLAEEEALESGAVGLVGEDGDEGAGAALLHADGGGHDVEGAEGEGLLGDVGEDLGAEVVEGGFEDGDGVGVGRRGCGSLRRRWRGGGGCAMRRWLRTSKYRGLSAPAASPPPVEITAFTEAGLSVELTAS